MTNTKIKSVYYYAPNQSEIWFMDGEQRKAIFNSYGKNIVEKNFTTGEILLDETYWNYSNTTSKYRCKFLNELGKETQKKIKSGKYKLVDLNNN